MIAVGAVECLVLERTAFQGLLAEVHDDMKDVISKRTVTTISYYIIPRHSTFTISLKITKKDEIFFKTKFKFNESIPKLLDSYSSVRIKLIKVAIITIMVKLQPISM